MVKPKRALILAAGLGSRLQHKTKEIPKALVEVKGKPIISHQLAALEKNNILDVGVVLGYKGELLKQYLTKTHSNFNFSFFINKDFESSNSAYSFYIASEYVRNEQYVHLNCDILFSHQLLNKLLTSKYENVIAINTCIKLSDNMELVELDEFHRINKMDNTFFEKAVGKAYGVAKLSPESSRFIIEKIESFIKKGDLNQNYYGMIRHAVKYFDYFAINSSDMLLAEINTLSDFDKVVST